jgi:hypothetical protein
MVFSREYLTARHAFAMEQIALPSPYSLEEALSLERIGNWQLAGETYSKLDEVLGTSLPLETRAKILARSGTCFEIASQPRPAARAYSDAARLLSSGNSRPQTAGELYNRAAHQHFAAHEYFVAGSSWRAAAAEFKKLGKSVITSHDSILPVPVSAAGLTISGNCLEAAGDAFLRTSGQEVWACGSYWEAGNAYATTFPSPNIQSFNAYRKALNATITWYRTLELDRLRLTLPLSEEERAAKLNPLKVLEGASFRCDHHHQPPTPEPKRSAIAQLQTDRRLAQVFREFSFLFSDIANLREAALFRVAEKDRISRIYFAERQYAKWVLYSFWNLTSGYGESLVRFTSLGYGDFHPSSTLGKILASAEIVLGLIMFGVLLSFLGNRFRQT